MHRFYRTNDGLGYGQYAYVLKLNDKEDLCCSSPLSNYADGLCTVFDGTEYNLEEVTKETFLHFSHVPKSLIEYLTREK